MVTVMKLLCYEIKKVFGQRFFVVLTAVLLVICASFCIFSIRGSVSVFSQPSMKDAYDLYNEDPDKAQALFEEYEANLKSGIEVPMEYTFLRGVIQRVDGNEQLFENFRKIADSAHRKALELGREGYVEGDFIYDYQKNCEEMYRSAFENMTLPVEFIFGWNNYFSQTYLTYLILAAVFLLVCAVYIPESTDSIYPLLWSMKRSRCALSGAKLATVIVLSLCISLLFSGTVLLVIAMRLGLSSLDLPVQMLDGFNFCPYDITIGEYLMIHTSIRCTVVIVYALICAAITTIRCDYIVSFVGTCIFVFVNYLLNTAQYSSVNNPAKHFNLFSLCDCGGIFSRYYAVDFNGSLVSLEHFGLYLIIPLIIILVAVSYLNIAIGRAHLNSGGIVTRLMKKIRLHMHLRKGKRQKLRICYAKFLFFEAHKVLGKIGLIMILIVLAVFRINSAINMYASTHDSDEIFYREYMERLDGEYTEQKAQYVSDEVKHINESIKRYETIMDGYNVVEISHEEYMEIIEAANYAYSHKAAAERVLEYMQKMRDLRDHGEYDAIFLYESGWKLLLERDADILAFFLILIATCNIFGVEFGKTSSTGRFADILRSSKKGRKRVFYSKFTVAVLFALVAFAIFEVIDYCLIIKNYTLPHAESGSVIICESVVNNGIMRFKGISLATFALVGTLLRAVATIFFAIAVFTLSAYIKKSISVMVITVLILFLPSVIAGSSNLFIISKIDFLPIASGVELIKISELANPELPFAMPLAATIVLLAMSVLIIVVAHVAWCNSSQKSIRFRRNKNETLN